jgi:accessory colonization factor AcfC
MLDDVLKSIVFHANGCMAIIEAAAQRKVDAAFGWGAFEHLAPGRIEILPIAEKYCVYRGTGVALLSFSRNPVPAEEFMSFLTSARSRPFFAELGWVV